MKKNNLKNRREHIRDSSEVYGHNSCKPSIHYRAASFTPHTKPPKPPKRNKR